MPAFMTVCQRGRGFLIKSQRLENVRLRPHVCPVIVRRTDALKRAEGSERW